MIGDSRPNFMSKLDSRDPSIKLNKAGADWGNFVIDQMPSSAKSFGLQDGSELKRDIRVREPRALDIYGSRNKALKASYKRDALGNVIPDSGYKKKKKETVPAVPQSQRGGLKSKSTRPKNKGLI